MGKVNSRSFVLAACCEHGRGGCRAPILGAGNEPKGMIIAEDVRGWGSGSGFGNYGGGAKAWYRDGVDRVRGEGQRDREDLPDGERRQCWQVQQNPQPGAEGFRDLKIALGFGGGRSRREQES